MRPRALAWLALVLVACGGSTPTASVTTPTPRITLNSAEQSQLAELEARPLKLPPLGSDGSCPDTPMTTTKPYKDQLETNEFYGSGPVYGQGSPEIDSATNAWFNVTYLADPSVHGVILVRIQTLDGLHKGVFDGGHGWGPVVGTDKISGESVDLYGFAVLTTLRAKADPAYAEGWKTWPVRQGIDKTFRCVGIQIDSQDATEVMVAT